MCASHSQGWHFPSRALIPGSGATCSLKKFLLPPHSLGNHVSNCIKRIGFLPLVLMALFSKAWPELSCFEVEKISTLITLGDTGSYGILSWGRAQVLTLGSPLLSQPFHYPMNPPQWPVARSVMSPDGARKPSSPSFLHRNREKDHKTTAWVFFMKMQWSAKRCYSSPRIKTNKIKQSKQEMFSVYS